MYERLCRFYFNLFMLWACQSILVVGGLAQPRQQVTSARDAALRSFLKNYLRTAQFIEDKTTQYSSAFVRLDGEAVDVVVYVTGGNWCGSGGCTTLILAPKDSSYRVVTRITITRPPIRMLATKSNGWHDIGVMVQGGGIQPSYDALLPFDGKTYPNNPSVPPARRLAEKVTGEVLVLDSSEGARLYR